jgi:peptide/nickel transport system permease protein
VARHAAERLIHLLLVLWAVASLTFVVFRLMPGDPTLNFLSPTFNEETRAALLRSFGLDKPLWQQYLIYMGNLLRGDLGMSFLQGRPVAALLAAPEFWLGMLLLAGLAFQTGWFPTGGALSPGQVLGSLGSRIVSGDYWWHLALPALTLTLYLQGLPLLLMRATMLEVLNDEFITMARMKGLSRWSIVMRHAARNALLPVVTAFALGLGASIGGNVVVETVFAWPGIGRLLVQAVQGADYPLAEGAFLLIAAALVTMNTVADLVYALLDPRVTAGARG